MKIGLLQGLRELLWWLATAIFVCMVLAPIWIKVDYLYLPFSILSMGAIFTFARWIIFFRTIPYLNNFFIRIVVFILAFNTFFWLLNHFQQLVSIVDHYTLTSFSSGVKVEMNMEEQAELFKYIRSTILLGGIGGLIMNIFLILRLIYSFFDKQKGIRRFLKDAK